MEDGFHVWPWTLSPGSKVFRVQGSVLLIQVSTEFLSGTACTESRSPVIVTGGKMLLRGSLNGALLPPSGIVESSKLLVSM